MILLKKIILPGQTAIIKVKYNTQKLGIINKQITVRSNATNATVVLTIKGKVIPKPKEVVPQKQIDNNSSPAVK